MYILKKLLKIVEYSSSKVAYRGDVLKDVIDQEYVKLTWFKSDTRKLFISGNLLCSKSLLKGKWS